MEQLFEDYVNFSYFCTMNIAQIKQAAIEAMGFDRLNAMQEVMLEEKSFGQNTLLLSPTGSGKTIAFLLPLIKHLSDQKSALVIVPSRELAIQIHEVFRKLKSGFRSVCCYGGHDIKKEIDALSGIGDNEPFLLIATSGRLKDHIERGNVPTNRISIVVLDEYDKSLELGFEDEMKFVVTSLSHVSQLILTSATHAMPIAPWLNFRNYRQIDFLKKDDMSEDSKYEVIDNLEIYQVKSPVKDKLDTLRDLLCSLDDDAQVIVFSNYRESSERIAHYLSDHGIESSLYHGGLEQDMREKALARFRGNAIRVLASTDLASRGLDIPEVSHIIHYHLPADEEAFVHRNGRTARAGASGTAYLIIGPEEFVPAYLAKEPKYFRIRPNGTFKPSAFVSIYIGRGKKDKISKGDVLGFLTKNGGIDGSQIGRIDIYERCAYCAVRREVAKNVVEKVKGLKIKGEKTHYLIVSGS